MVTSSAAITMSLSPDPWIPSAIFMSPSYLLGGFYDKFYHILHHPFERFCVCDALMTRHKFVAHHSF